jgi:hypothetical protein
VTTSDIDLLQAKKSTLERKIGDKEEEAGTSDMSRVTKTLHDNQKGYILHR